MTDWASLDPAIQEMLVDLKYRGDYTPATPARIQKYVAANELEGLAKQFANPRLWPNVPTDRFRRRKKFVEEAAAKRRLNRPKTMLPRWKRAKPSEPGRILRMRNVLHGQPHTAP